MLIEPPQLGFIGFVSGFVSLLAKPTHRRVLPDVPRSVAKFLEPPDFAFQLIVQFLRLAPVVGLSRSAYSLTVRRAEVDPPDLVSLA
jgi:hypothetical protein